MEIVKTKLPDHGLSPLNVTNLTPQSSGENIKAVVSRLKALQKDGVKKKWKYTWGGKEVIIVQQLGKILKIVEPYSKLVGTAMQSTLQVSALVWAGVEAITRVCIK